MPENLTEKQLTGIPKWALSWEPRAKLIAAILYIFGVISLSTPTMAVIAYAISAGTALIMGISIVLLLKRYLIIAPFLLLMTVPLLFSQGLTPTSVHVSFALLIIIKAFTSMTIITIVLDSQTLEGFMNSLAGLKVPPIIITVLMHAFRYVYLFLDDIQKTQVAAKSRLFNGGIRLKSLKVYGQLTGALLLRSLDRSDRVYQAMVSRCFDGTLHLNNSQRKITGKDLMKTSFASIIIILLLIIEKAYIT